MRRPSFQSPPGFEQLLAAEEALRREWAEIKEEVLRADRAMDDDDHEARAAAARRMHELLTGFVERHRKALLARGQNRPSGSRAFPVTPAIRDNSCYS